MSANKFFLGTGRIRLIFILSSLVLAGLFLFMFLQVKNLIASSDDLNHAGFVETTLQNIFSDISYAETSQRGFLLTGDSIHLVNRDTAFSRLPGNLQVLDSLFSNDSAQQANLAELRLALDHKYRIMKDVMDLTPSGYLNERAKDSIRVASSSMEKVKAGISKITVTEKLHLEKKKIRYSNLSFFTPILSIVLFIVAFILTLFSYSRLYASVRQSAILQDALYNEKNLAETILNSSVDLIAMYDTEQRVLYYNNASEEAFGKAREKVIGKKLEEIFPGFVNTKGFNDLNKAIKGEKIHNDIYYSPIRKRYYENFLTPLLSEDGKVYAVLVVAHDNTELINSANTISQNNKALEEAQRLANVGSWEWNTASNEMVFSPYMRQIYGLKGQEEVSFSLFTESIHQADKQFVKDSIQRAVKTKSPFEIQFRLQPANGSLRYLLAKGKCELNKNDKVVRMLGSIQDITARVESEELLRQSQEKFNKLFQLSPFSISLSDMNGKFIDINENFIRTFGYSREDLIGKTSADINLIDAGMRQRILEELRMTGTIKNIEIEVIKKNGQVVPVLVSIERITIGDESFYLNAIIDIAERKRAEEKIEQANQRLQRMNKELESFAYVASHDLQEPLRKIQTFSSRIMEKENANLSESGKDQFGRIQKAARRMQTLIEDLLSYSRAGTEEKQFVKTNLNKLSNDAAEDFKEEITTKGGSIEIGPMCEAEVIPFQFRQLLQNLLSNSIKFADPERPLKIIIDSKVTGSPMNSFYDVTGEKMVHIQISDNGIGFEKEFNEKIFEVFQRLHGRDKYIGTGIGLAIVKKIVENHNGIITACGEPGKGATFNIYIPATIDN